jgi:hypothetical protein
MRKSNYLVMFSVLLGLILSCKKEPIEPINSDGSLIFGNIPPNFNITTFDSSVSIIAAWHSSASYQFDIDSDGVNDFKLNSVYSASPGGIDQREASIDVLNSTFQISVSTLLDSIFQCKYIENDTLKSITYYNGIGGYSCSGSNLNSFSRVDTTVCPKIYSIGDTIGNEGNWVSNSVKFSIFNNDNLWVLFPVQNTCIFRGNWNNTNMKYLLFRINNNGQFRYGWLKLSIDEYNHIRFHEYAMQK